MTLKKMLNKYKIKGRGNDIPIIKVVPRKGYWAIYPDRKEWYDDPTAGTEYALNPFAGTKTINTLNTMDYSQFDNIVKKKKKQGKFLTLDVNDTEVFTFLGMEAIKRQNPFSGELEDAWLVKLLDDEGNEKQWTFSSLSVFNQFKEQNIQENDKIRITKGEINGKARYSVEKMLLDKNEHEEENS